MTTAYEDTLSGGLDRALREGSMHFGQKGTVHETLRRIAARLDEQRVAYALGGGMALFAHGLRRFTEDVDILVTPDGLQRIHEQLSGLGYVPLFEGSKNLRDTQSGVRIEFLLAGDFPGDGRPKPVAFPEPAAASIEREGIRWLTLPKLIELKLASGMTAPGRLRDLADVQELIRLLNLPRDYTEQLDPYVHERYTELWQSVQ